MPISKKDEIDIQKQLAVIDVKLDQLIDQKKSNTRVHWVFALLHLCTLLFALTGSIYLPLSLQKVEPKSKVEEVSLETEEVHNDTANTKNVLSALLR